VEALANRFQKAMVTHLESNRDRCVRVIAQVEGVALSPPPVRRFRKFGKPLIFRPHSPAKSPGTTIPGRPVPRLRMRADFADGGKTIARALDEGLPPPAIK
jgi:hypothetical protein